MKEFLKDLLEEENPGEFPERSYGGIPEGTPGYTPGESLEGTSGCYF